MITLRKLTPGEVHAYRGLRLHGLQESPAAFGASFAQESARDLAFFENRTAATKDQWILGAFDEARLCGVVGFARDDGPKTSHKGLIWGMYVHPGWRRKGVGRRLMEAMLAELDALPGLRWVRLSVTAGNDGAQRLYESFGFAVYGEEPEVLWVNGVFYAERHMVRRINASGQTPPADCADARG
jgi:ribosomal protein S18 acetylase RimI-like enzyme